MIVQGHQFDVDQLARRARQMRATIVQMAHDGKEGHLSSSLSCVDVLVALYGGWLRVDRVAPQHPDRDRFYMSKGHACAALYAVLADRGFFPRAWLADYAKQDAALRNHPDRYALPLLECSFGSLGQGLGIAAGALYGLRLDGNDRSRAVVLMSDGECNEGSVWEAAMFAAAQRLDRLLAIVDYNRVQAVGRTDEIMGYTSLEEKFRAFGWAAMTIDGNDMAAVAGALSLFPFEAGRPSAVIARTTGGAGVRFMEDDVFWHYRVPSTEELQRALAELGERPLHMEGA